MPDRKRQRYIVGVDLGGTNIVAGAMPEDGSREIAMRSEPTLADEGAVTLLSYAVNAQIGGRIAQVGQRLVDSAALKLADDFFAAFERGLAPAAPAGAHAESVLEEIEESAVLHDPRTWNWVGWLVLLLVMVALAALLLR